MDKIFSCTMINQYFARYSTKLYFKIYHWRYMDKRPGLDVSRFHGIRLITGRERQNIRIIGGLVWLCGAHWLLGFTSEWTT